MWVLPLGTVFSTCRSWRWWTSILYTMGIPLVAVLVLGPLAWLVLRPQGLSKPAAAHLLLPNPTATLGASSSSGKPSDPGAAGAIQIAGALRDAWDEVSLHVPLQPWPCPFLSLLSSLVFFAARFLDPSGGSPGRPRDRVSSSSTQGVTFFSLPFSSLPFVLWFPPHPSNVFVLSLFSCLVSLLLAAPRERVGAPPPFWRGKARDARSHSCPARTGG